MTPTDKKKNWSIDLLNAASVKVTDAAVVLSKALGFNGRWLDRGKKLHVINGVTLMSPGAKNSELLISGNKCTRNSPSPSTGELREDGTIAWEDGAIWHREQTPQLLTIDMQDGSVFEIMGGIYHDSRVMKRAMQKLYKEGKIRNKKGIINAGTPKQEPDAGTDIGTDTLVGLGSGALGGTITGFGTGVVSAMVVMASGPVVADVLIGAVVIAGASLTGAAAGAAAGVGVGAAVGLIVGGGAAIYHSYKINKGTSYYASEKLFDKLWCLTQHFERCGSDVLVRKGVKSCPK